MKKFLTILMIAMMLLVFVSCEGGFVGFMGQMGQNVMGSDTSKASKAAESTKVDESKIEKPSADGKYTFGGEGGITVTVDKGTTILPPIENKDEVLSNIGASLTSEANRDALVEEMKKKPSETVQKAASGTATVMVEAIDQIAGEGAESSLPVEVKEVLNNVTSALNNISSKHETVTQADVVTLQLVSDMVVSLNKSVDKETGKLTVSEDLISDANNLVTVISAISAAGNFNALEGISINDLLPKKETSPEPTARVARAARAAEDNSFELAIGEGSEQTVKYIRMAYTLISGITGTDVKAFDSLTSGIAMHKFAYENYVALVTVMDENQKKTYTESKEFKDFALFNNVLKYVAVSAVSIADPVFDKLDAKLGDEISLEESYTNIVGLLNKLVELNPWIADKSNPSEVESIKYPEEFKAYMDEDKFDALLKDLEEIVKEEGVSLLSTCNTIEAMVPYIGLESSSDQVIGFLNTIRNWINPKEEVR